jgi:type IV pilus assembly protein PilA
MDKGALPLNNGEAGLEAAANITGNYASNVNVVAGVVTVTYSGPDVNAQIGGQTLTLTPTTNAGSVSWACSRGTLAAKHVPSACR